VLHVSTAHTASSLADYRIFAVRSPCESRMFKRHVFQHLFFSSRRRHTRSVSAFLLNRSSDLFIAFRWIHLSTPLIRLFLLVLILLLMPTLNFLPVWFALSLLRFRLPSRLPMMFILWMVAMMVVIIPSRTV